MVATIQLLTGAANQVRRYYMSVSSYYAADETGVWFGDAASALGVNRTMSAEEFMNVLTGKNAAGRQLVPLRKKRVCGSDITFSVPKSVSALAVLGNDEVQNATREAMESACESTLAIMQQHLPLARRGKGGMKRETAAIVVARFTHWTNRDDEPQLHCHCVIPNLCRLSSGKWQGIDNWNIHRWTPALGRIFRSELARELKTRLDVELFRPESADGQKQAWFEVRDIPSRLMKHWSSRRTAIELSAGYRSSARQRQIANQGTRRKKQHTPLSELLTSWRQEAKSMGLGDFSIHLARGHRPTRFDEVKYQATLDRVLNDLTRDQAHFSEIALVEKLFEATLHLGLDGQQVYNRIKKDLKESSKLVPLTNKRGIRRFTTREMWQLEKKLLGHCHGLRQRPGACVSQSSLASIFARRSNRELSTEQRDAVAKLTTSQNALRVLTGVAGAGKSTALKAVRQAFEAEGYTVIGGALAGVAKQELIEKTRIPSRTVASYLFHLDATWSTRMARRLQHDARMLCRALLGRKTYAYRNPVKINAKTVLVLDEAGLLDTRSLERLMHHVQSRHATLILCGDIKQLPPIRAGGPFTHLTKELPHAELQHNYRQRDRDDRQAVSLFRTGEINEALTNYHRRGRLTITNDHLEAKEALVRKWLDNNGFRRPKDHMILTQTRADALSLNLACQAECKRLRRIPRPSVRHEGIRYYASDRVILHVGIRKYGIENGHRGTVVDTDRLQRTITVRLDQKPTLIQELTGSFKSTIKIQLSDLKGGGLSLGYAATTHKLQGQSIPHSYVLMGKMDSHEMAYVQLSRGSESTRLFVAADGADEKIKEIIKSLSRSVAKNLAHDVYQKSEQTPSPNHA